MPGSSNNKILEFENDLKKNGLNYLRTSNNKEIRDTVSYLKSEKFEEFDKWLRNYKHCEYVICPWTREKIRNIEKQLINRFQHYNKYGYDNDSIDEYEDDN
jgi:3-methyladenine DNA glycosylase AlkC